MLHIHTMQAPDAATSGFQAWACCSQLRQLHACMQPHATDVQLHATQGAQHVARLDQLHRLVHGMHAAAALEAPATLARGVTSGSCFAPRQHLRTQHMYKQHTKRPCNARQLIRRTAAGISILLHAHKD